MLEVKFKQKESIAIYLKEAQEGILDAVKKVIVRTANDIKKDTTNEMMFGKKTGNIYTFRGRSVRASAPGEVPAVRSGKLKRSVRVTHNRIGLSAMIGTPVDYSVYLAKNRPIVDFGLDRNAELFVARMRSALS